jgi:hypothetical protein
LVWRTGVSWVRERGAREAWEASSTREGAMMGGELVREVLFVYSRSCLYPKAVSCNSDKTQRGIKNASAQGE